MIDTIINGLLSGAAYALIAVGFVMIYKGSRIFNLAHGEIGAFGLYIAWDLQHRGIPVIVAFVVGIAVATVVGVIVERTLVRRLVDRTPLAALACTLGVAFLLAYFEVIHYGANIKTFPPPFGTFTLHFGSLIITSSRIMALVFAAAVAGGLAYFLKRTKFGLEVSATVSDKTLARLSGIRVDRTRAFVWALGGATSGIAAMLIASVNTFHPLSTTLVLVRALTAALLGGLTSLTGAFVGGMAIGVVESLVIAHSTIAGAADTAIFLVLLLALLLRPQGVFGGSEA
ncbi:MAG: branched-chain amino acid ABC transporter permease [Actinomycetota bacterium]